MAQPSPVPAYLLGVPLVFVGLSALRKPVPAHEMFGVPSTVPKDGVSPFLYAKALRDVALGLACLGLQYQGNDSAVTAIMAVSVMVGIGDGCIVWSSGGDGLRHKAWGHWVGTSILVAPWVVARLLA